MAEGLTSHQKPRKQGGGLPHENRDWFHADTLALFMAKVEYSHQKEHRIFKYSNPPDRYRPQPNLGHINRPSHPRASPGGPGEETGGREELYFTAARC